MIIASVLLLLQNHFSTTSAFVATHAAKLFQDDPPASHKNNFDRFLRQSYLSDDFNDNSGSSDSGSSPSSFEEMRQLLENSWNVTIMGRTPTNPESAVDECVDAMQRLLKQKHEDNDDKIVYFIDILLPQYDISYGDKIYDEVYTAEFCTQFIQHLQIPTVLVYRDQQSVNTISRILNARKSTKILDKEEGQPVEYDDFVSESMQNDDPNIFDFRKSLMQSWETTASTADEENSNIPDEEKIQPDKERIDTTISSNSQQQTKLCYRIGSLFGSATISKGADMIEDVMMAIQMNDGLPLDHEQMMMIVSPISKEEMYAIRAIVNKYNEAKGKKVLIIFFNCKLQPMPQEIIRGETIYSLLPLIGKRKESSTLNTSRSPYQPKVVVLRRYPHDWQIYVDLDDGFNCIASISAQDVKLNRLSQQRGPSLEWIQTVVQRYMQQQPPPQKS
jgi:hypothetical protein